MGCMVIEVTTGRLTFLDNSAKIENLFEITVRDDDAQVGHCFRKLSFELCKHVKVV